MRVHRIINPTNGGARRRPEPALNGRPLTRRSSVQRAPSGETKDGRSAVIWFQNHLRLGDHPGLQTVASTQSIERLTPCYLLDPALLTGLASRPAGPEVLVSALTVLREQLRSRGSDLVIRVGPCGNALRGVIADSYSSMTSGGEIGGTLLVAEDEIGGAGSRLVAEALRAVSKDTADDEDARRCGGGSTTVVHSWCSPKVWDRSSFQMNYRLWADSNQRGPPSRPFEAPASLPPLPLGITPGDIPTAKQLRVILRDAYQTSGKNIGSGELITLQTRIDDLASSSLESQLIASIASSKAEPSEILSAYLSPVDASNASGPELRRLHQMVSSAAAALELPSAPGSSFKAILGPWMELGALSHRQVLEFIAGRIQGDLIPDRVSAAIKAVEVSEFHQRLAAEGAAAGRPKEVTPAASAGGYLLKPSSSPKVHQFRWRGVRNEYCVSEPVNPRPGSPAILLVHGFGAFGDQWRNNMEELAAAGFRVFAPTLPGFGRSEKAAMSYSQDSWRDFLRDFTLSVVKCKTVVAGNSIGGFIATSMAADYPELVSGLILLNSAGKIDPDFDIVAWEEECIRKKPPPRFVVEAFSRLLFWYLEGSIGKTLKWLYPTSPNRADSWLAEEIYRSACDRGSLEVFQSAFYLPPPRALNYLISSLYKGPTLVLQGVLDPLNDAQQRAKDLAKTCPDYVRMVLVEAGHCPHDEQPEKINFEILRFMKDRVLRTIEEDDTLLTLA